MLRGYIVKYLRDQRQRHIHACQQEGCEYQQHVGRRRACTIVCDRCKEGLQGNDLVRHVAGKAFVEVGEAADGGAVDQLAIDLTLVTALIATH